MKRVICLAVVLLFSLTCTSPALAGMHFRNNPIKARSNTLSLAAVMSLPITLFVTISQKPTLVVGTSVQSLLRQVLIGQKKTHGMPLVARGARI